MKKCILVLWHILLFNVLNGQQMESSPTINQNTLHTERGNWSYAVSNSGKRALLFIHGASSSKRIWHHQYNLVIPGYKNIFVDLLGYGESDKPATGLNLSNWIEGLHQILIKEQVQKVCIIGHSNGAIIAKEYYRAYPDEVIQLLLLDGMLKLNDLRTCPGMDECRF